MYKEELKKLTLFGIIGFIIGFIIAHSTMPEVKFVEKCFFGMFFAGLPYGWKISGYVLDGWLIIGNVTVVIITFMLRVIISLVVGWIAYPIALIYYIVKIRRNPNI